MKRFLIVLFAATLVLFLATAAARADGLLAKWTPAQGAESGPLGSGIGTMVRGMMEYRTLPNRHYIVLGYIRASNGWFGSARTRAVAMARRHGADAIIALNRSTRSAGHFLLNGKAIESCPFAGTYVAIRFLQRKREKPAWGIAGHSPRGARPIVALCEGQDAG